MDVQIRWLIRRDMAEVMEIERQSFSRPWSDDDFRCCLRQRNCIGMVAEFRHKIVGFMVYELLKTRLNILNFAVHPAERLQKVGTQMVQRLVDKLSQQRRTEIFLEIRERNLDAQLFFQKQRFRFVCVLRNHYEDTDEDAYVFLYRVGAEHFPEDAFQPRNRISGLI